MRATTTLVLFILVPCLGACDYQLGDLPGPDEDDDSALCAPDAGSGPPPELALVGPATQSHECATAYTDPGATASDVCFGDLTRDITRAGDVDTHAPGSYSLTYNVSNPAGQSATPVTRTVNVQDTQPPVVTTSGPLNVALECGSPYTDPGAAGSDECAGTVPAIPTSLPDPNTPGSYSLRYQATDPSGNVAVSSEARTVTVADTLAPSLELVGPINATHECGATYADPGATASDLCAGDLTGAVVATQTGDPNLPGTLTINYSVTDPSGHTTVAAQPRVVNVTDTLPPVLVLMGSATQAQECASPYTDPGATAMDGCFGDVTSRITRAGTVDPSVVGSYSLTYSVTDPAGHSANASRTVNVTDTEPPLIGFNGPISMPLECGSPWVDPGATASDECAGDLPAVPTGAPDPETVGTYSFGYQATDPSGNTGTSLVSRTVTVLDTVPPTIVVTPPLDQQLECGDVYVDPGATATDVCAGPVPVTATREGSSTTPGQFIIRYSAQDPAGNSVTSPVARTVRINDNTPPVLTLLGPATVMLECATPYNDPGATAADACFGDLSGSILVFGEVDTTSPAIYTLEYQVTDPAGNWATPVTRTVNVGDREPPVVTIVGPLNQNVECGTQYADQGALANDACNGPLPAEPTSLPDTSTAGIYTFWYQATDLSGNTGTSAQGRTVTVIDVVPPTLTLNGPSLMMHECGAIFEDPGATSADTCAGDLTEEIVATRTGSPDVPGTMNIFYSVTDPSGNTTSLTVPRVVSIVDTQGPAIELLPGPSVIECNGPPYVEPGARAIDQCSGDRTHEINVTGSVDHTRAGEYTIAYDVTDPAGNTSIAIRPITVGPCAVCFSFALSDYNLLLLEDSGAVHSVEGREEAGGEHGAGRFVELRSLAWRLSRLTAHGETTSEGRGILSLKGADPELNVFEVKAEELTRETQLSIDAPAGSLVVLNVRGDAVVLEGLRSTLSGGIDAQDVVYNFVDAKNIRAEGAELEGTVLAPYARIDLNGGSWKGGLYAVSLTGNAQGYLSPLRDRTLCP